MDEMDTMAVKATDDFSRGVPRMKAHVAASHTAWMGVVVRGLMRLNTLLNGTPLSRAKAKIILEFAVMLAVVHLRRQLVVSELAICLRLQADKAHQKEAEILPCQTIHRWDCHCCFALRHMMQKHACGWGRTEAWQPGR